MIHDFPHLLTSLLIQLFTVLRIAKSKMLLNKFVVVGFLSSSSPLKQSLIRGQGWVPTPPRAGLSGGRWDRWCTGQSGCRSPRRCLPSSRSKAEEKWCYNTFHLESLNMVIKIRKGLRLCRFMHLKPVGKSLAAAPTKAVAWKHFMKINFLRYFF